MHLRLSHTDLAQSFGEDLGDVEAEPNERERERENVFGHELMNPPSNSLSWMDEAAHTDFMCSFPLAVLHMRSLKEGEDCWSISSSQKRILRVPSFDDTSIRKHSFKLVGCFSCYCCLAFLSISCVDVFSCDFPQDHSFFEALVSWIARCNCDVRCDSNRTPPNR